jgi:23S rRNA pseudouridine2604 synthase
MRINRYISNTGACSRREADGWIQAGRVTLNGRVAVVGDQVEVGDDVRVDGKSVVGVHKRVIVAYNKPPGIECTTDMRITGNIVEAAKHPERVFPVGRLDKFSEGLILLTNDGDIVNRILRSRNGNEKEYVVELDAPLSDEERRQLERGVELDDGRGLTKRCVVRSLGGARYQFILTEGRNRQIRKMAEIMGRRVRALQRVRVMHIRLGNLPLGRWRDLVEAELNELDERLQRASAEPEGSED